MSDPIDYREKFRDEKAAAILKQLHDLERANANLRATITTMREDAERHNKQAYATGLIVRCTGCDAGAPDNADELTDEHIAEIRRLAMRLEVWLKNKRYRESMQGATT
jgi:hypothetical protein